MSRADYAHWNEEQDRVWWEEEGKHYHEPQDDPDYDRERELDARDAYCESVAEMETHQIVAHLRDTEYLQRWPKAEDILRDELGNRHISGDNNADPLD